MLAYQGDSIINANNIFTISDHVVHSTSHDDVSFKAFLQSQRPKQMIDYYRQICNETHNVMYIEQGNLKLYGSSIYWPCILVRGFDREAIAQAEIFAETDIHRVYSRLVSFTCPLYSQEQKLFDIFEEQTITAQRELNSIEHKLFKLVTYKGQVEECKFVSSLTEFNHNMNIRFHYDKWGCLIDYNSFYLAGGCIVTCLLRHAQILNGQDCDFFYKGNSKNHFLQSVNAIQKKLAQYFLIRRTARAQQSIIDLVLVINNNVESMFENKIQITLQFVYLRDNCSSSSCISSFDMDLPQIIYDGECIRATRAAIESMRTKTIIHYGLTKDNIDYPRIALRLNKYLKRGLNLLVPHKFCLSQFINCPLHVGNMHGEIYYHNSYSYNTSAHNAIIYILRKNCDIFHIQDQFYAHVLTNN